MKSNRPLVVSLGVLALLLTAAWVFFFFVPHYVDGTHNILGGEVGDPGPHEIPPLHSQLRVADLHADPLMWDRDLLQRADRGHIDLPRLREGNVALEVFSVVTKTPKGLNIDRNDDKTDNITLLAIAQRWPVKSWSHLSERALYQARRLKDFEVRSGGEFRRILTKRDLAKFLADRAANPKLTAGVLAMEGAHALEGDLGKLDAMDEAGFRILAPTHLFDSEWAGAQAGVIKGGLTGPGKAWLAKMEEKRLIVDLAHASSQTIDDVLSLATRPMIVSHTGVKGVCDNNRNLTDDQLRRIAAKGGLVGIGLWDQALCSDRLEAAVKSIQHAIQVMGADHVALGSDWDGYVKATVDASRIGWLTGALLKAGVAEDDVRKVMGENVFRFFGENLPE